MPTLQQANFFRDVMYTGKQSHRTGLASVLEPSLGSSPNEYKAYLLDQVRSGNTAVIAALRSEKMRRNTVYSITMRFDNSDINEGGVRVFGSSGIGGRQGEGYLQTASAVKITDLPTRQRYLNALNDCYREAITLYGTGQQEPWRTTDPISYQRAQQGGSRFSTPTERLGGTPIQKVVRAAVMGPQNYSSQRQMVGHTAILSPLDRMNTPTVTGVMGTQFWWVQNQRITQSVAETTSLPSTTIARSSANREVIREQLADIERRERGGFRGNRPTPFEPFVPSRTAGHQGVRAEDIGETIRGGRRTLSLPIVQGGQTARTPQQEWLDKEHTPYLRSKAWERKKEEFAAFKGPQGQKCAYCGSRSGLHVHHTSYKRHKNESMSDLTYLCDHHHEQVDDKLNQYGLTVENTQAVLDTDMRASTLYHERPVPFGRYKGVAIADLPGGVLASMIDDPWVWTHYTRFAKTLAHASKQRWVQEKIEKYEGQTSGRFSPLDRMRHLDPYSSTRFDRDSSNRKGGRDYYRSADADMWMEGTGVTRSGEAGQQVRMTGMGPAGPKGENVQMNVGVTNYGDMPGALKNVPQLGTWQTGYRTGKPSRLESFGDDFTPGEAYMTPYRWHDRQFPSRANEQRFVKEYDPERNISAREREVWEVLGGIPRPEQWYVDSTGRKRKIPAGFKGAFRGVYRGDGGDPVFRYAGARSVLQARLNEMYAMDMNRHLIDVFRREFVKQYTLINEPRVKEIMKQDRIQGVLSRGIDVDPLGPEAMKEYQGQLPDPQIDFSEKGASKEDFPGEYSDVAESARSVITSREIKESEFSAMSGRMVKKKRSRRKDAGDPFASSNLDPHVINMHVVSLSSAPNIDVLDLAWEQVQEDVGDDNALVGFRKLFHARRSEFNRGAAP